MNRKTPPKRGFSKSHLRGEQFVITICACLVHRIIIAQTSYFSNSLHVGVFCCVWLQSEALRVCASANERPFIKLVLIRVDYGPTPDRHDQHVYAWETTSTSLYGYAGKVGIL
jgi:hypothetical protein